MIFPPGFLHDIRPFVSVLFYADMRAGKIDAEQLCSYVRQMDDEIDIGNITDIMRRHGLVRVE